MSALSSQDRTFPSTNSRKLTVLDTTELDQIAIERLQFSPSLASHREETYLDELEFNPSYLDEIVSDSESEPPELEEERLFARLEEREIEAEEKRVSHTADTEASSLRLEEEETPFHQEEDEASSEEEAVFFPREEESYYDGEHATSEEDESPAAAMFHSEDEEEIPAEQDGEVEAVLRMHLKNP